MNKRYYEFLVSLKRQGIIRDFKMNDDYTAEVAVFFPLCTPLCFKFVDGEKEENED